MNYLEERVRDFKKVFGESVSYNEVLKIFTEIKSNTFNTNVFDVFELEGIKGDRTFKEIPSKNAMCKNINGFFLLPSEEKIWTFRMVLGEIIKKKVFEKLQLFLYSLTPTELEFVSEFVNSGEFQIEAGDTARKKRENDRLAKRSTEIKSLQRYRPTP